MEKPIVTYVYRVTTTKYNMNTQKVRHYTRSRKRHVVATLFLLKKNKFRVVSPARAAPRGPIALHVYWGASGLPTTSHYM